MKSLRTALCVIMTLTGWTVVSAEEGDSLRISLLTCSPGQEVYALFGHTALRCENSATGEDWVFNYGMFSFQTPHFVMRFVRGETDYQLGVVPYAWFEEEYRERGSYVEQQVLNLRPEERSMLVRLLAENYRPENRTYRYNYFYDNCTTRARDKVEECIGGEVGYPRATTPFSYRDIIHQYTKGHEWAEFGIDLCLGSEADRPLTEREQMFAPFYLLRAADSAFVRRADGTEEPLVASKNKAFPVPAMVQNEREDIPFTPMEVFLCLLAFTALAGGVELRFRRYFWGVDLLLFGGQGIAGCIIAYLFFFSLHPAVSSNWLLILFNPLPLVFLPLIIRRALKGKRNVYHWVNVVMLSLLMAGWGLMPQHLNGAILPIALSLWGRSLTHIIRIYKNRLR